MTLDQTSMLADEQAAQPSPVAFASRHHVALTVTALEDRAAVIEGLAKKTRDEGYHRMSRELQADVTMIRGEILPDIREQRELSLAGGDEASSAIANLLRPTLHSALKLKNDEETMLERIADRLLSAFEKVYETGFAVGVSNRLNEPDFAIVRACMNAGIE